MARLHQFPPMYIENFIDFLKSQDYINHYNESAPVDGVSKKDFTYGDKIISVELIFKDGVLIKSDSCIN